MRVIFVCTGNTCRSPMAEKMFESMTKDKGIEVESRGVMCSENMPMNLNARVVMKEMGLGTEHKSKSLTKEDIESADLIVTMTASHKLYIESLFGKHDNVKTLDSFTHTGDVIDPYGGDVFEYRRCARKLMGDLEILKDILVKE